MFTVAIGGLVVSVLLSAAAVLSFSWSVTAAQAILRCGMVAAGIGALGASGLAAKTESAPAAWTFVFAFASCGCGLNAIRNLFSRPIRWIHRFTIYSGYGATFAAMGIATLELQRRGTSVRWAIATLIGTYVLGSACIFLAKTLTVSRALKTMPEYRAALGGNEDGRGYW